MAVFNPLEIEITNWPDGQVVEVDGVNNPEDESAGIRKIPFSGRLFIEQEDFQGRGESQVLPPQEGWRSTPA